MFLYSASLDLPLIITSLLLMLKTLKQGIQNLLFLLHVQ